MPLSVIPFGPYDLRVPIGRGGMGEVWRATHRQRGAPVAVKLMRAATASRPELVACFHREVRAAAALNHPHIAPVLDAGEVGRDFEARSSGRFKAGSPFLVTELAFGSLAGSPPPVAWAEVRPIVLALLSALAHAHARGVTHRDLKPGNVLLAAPPEATTPDALPLGVGTLTGQKAAHVLLADFGLAWTAKDGRSEVDTASGTPAYMAPEQLDGRWRDIGPWTDVYGLGCLVWWLVAGRTPLQPRNFEQALLHQHRMLPPLRPLFATPDGLESWLLRMVARDPGARFQTAADALWALQSLPELDGSARSEDRARPLDPDITLPLREPGARQVSALDSVQIVLPFVRRPPPMPPTWRGITPTRGKLPVLSDGLSLFGIRPPPMQGREVLRDLLWQELRAVHAERRARAVVLGGLPGTGKSRLARWLVETATEVGAAEPLCASFGGRGGEGGLAELVRQTLGCAGLAGEPLQARVETWLMRHGLQDPVATRALSRLASQAPSGLGDREVFEAVRALVSLLGRLRPVILWLDDAHACPLGLALTEHLLATGGSLPVLMVLTTRHGSEREGQAASRLRSLLGAPLVRSLEVGQLPVGDHRELVRALLPLDPDLSARVEERTSGNPGFASALLAALAQAGMLSLGEQGLELRPEAELVPAELLGLLEPELGRLLGDVSEDERDALVLAALFGETVDTRTWEGACAVAGLPVPEARLRRLQSAGLVRALAGHRPSFSFAHPLVREYLERAAQTAGRLQALHRACAEVFLSGRATTSAARLERHLFAAMEPLAVIDRLDQATGLSLRDPLPEALALVRLRERALDEAGVRRSDSRWGALWLERARLLLAACAPEEAAIQALSAEEAASRHGWRAVELGARMARGRAALLRGHLDLAQSLLADTLADCGEPGLMGLELELRLALSGLALRRRELDRANAELDHARRLGSARRSGAGLSLLACALGYLQGLVYLEGENLEAARGALREAMGGFHAHGPSGRLGEARCLSGLGTIARMEGLHARAERRMLQAITLSEIAGSAQALIDVIPLAILSLQVGDPWKARLRAGGALEHLERLGLEAEAALARLTLSVAALESGDQEGWQRAQVEPLAFFDSHRWSSVDLRWLLSRAEARARAEPSAIVDQGRPRTLVAR